MKDTPSVWDELGLMNKISAMLGLAFGVWGLPLFVLVLEAIPSGIIGEGEYGVGFLFLSLVPASTFLIISSLVLVFRRGAGARRDLTLLLFAGSLIPILMTAAYAIHLRYWCWPHHPIIFCA